MRIIHNAKFSDEERGLFRAALGSNIITGLRHLMAVAEEEFELAIAKKVRVDQSFLPTQSAAFPKTATSCR